MTREDIIRLAREAGWTEYSLKHPVESQRLDRFVARVAAAEREACAKIAEAWDADHPETNYGLCIGNAIRARGSK